MDNKNIFEEIIREYEIALDCLSCKQSDPEFLYSVLKQIHDGELDNEGLRELKGYFKGVNAARNMLLDTIRNKVEEREKLKTQSTVEIEVTKKE